MAISYPRRQQLRRLTRAATRAAQAGVALAAAVFCVRTGEGALASALALAAAALALSSRRALRLAGRSRVGAESEAQVRRVLEVLRRDGWQVSHAVDRAGGGDLDHVVRSPSGIGFVIATKTLRYTHAHVLRTAAAARRLARRRWYYPGAVRPVICVTRARWVERSEGGVLVVSLDRLMPALHRGAASPTAVVASSLSARARASRRPSARPASTVSEASEPSD